MAPECQEKNAKGLTMVAIGLNKAAEEFLILDEQTREDMASGKYRDQRRGTFGPIGPAAGPSPVPGSVVSAQPTRPARPARPRTAAPRTTPSRPAQSQPRPPWTPSQERLALLYNEQGLRPGEIAAKLGLSTHLVTQIILAARNRGKS